MSSDSTPDGLLLIDKPPGITSHDLVNIARRLYRLRRVGHTGTLDPNATGLMILCLGVSTRLAEYFTGQNKQYIAEVTFGVETDTQDIWGDVKAERGASSLTPELILELLPQFTGRILQTPPMVSARRHEGRHLYEIAREHREVERKETSVEISSLEMADFQEGKRARAVFHITCSSGTYIRTLAYDLGAKTGAGAVMSALRRTWIGKNEKDAYKITDAHSLEELSKLDSEGNITAAIIPPYEALASWPRIALSQEDEEKVRHGISIPIKAIPSQSWERMDISNLDCPIALFNLSQNKLIAVAFLRAEMITPVKVFA